MHFYLSHSDDPFYNLALEESLLKNSKEDILLCYVNAPSIILGRFQVPYREVKAPFVHSEKINIARRLSGGGTVFHDYGNLNYSYITNCLDEPTNYYDVFNQKVLAVLAHVGLSDLSFQRNNIFCQEKKISGVAQYKRGKRMVHHGTLLVEANLEQLRALFTKKSYYFTKGVASVSSSVANINTFVEVDMPDVIKAFQSSCVDVLAPIASDNDVLEMATYYSTREWVFGKAPKYTLGHSDDTIEVKNGKISAVSDARWSSLIGQYHCYEDVVRLEEEAHLIF